MTAQIVRKPFYLGTIHPVSVALEDTQFGYDKLYTYRMDAEHYQTLLPGMRVIVPFGGSNRARIGMVMEIGEIMSPTHPDAPRIKPILSQLDDEPVLTEELLHIVRQLHEITFCTWYDAVRAVLPGGLSVRLEMHYIPLTPPPGTELSQHEQDILHMLTRRKSGAERAELTMQCNRKGSAAHATMQELVRKGCIKEVPFGKYAMGDSTQRMIRLSNEFLTLPQAQDPSRAQLRAVNLLKKEGAMSVKECAYTAGIAESTVRSLVTRRIAEYFETEVLHVPRDAKPTVDPADTVLSPQQQAAYDAAAKAVLAKKAAAFLLYGVTGSGKTAVFEQLIALTLKEGRQVLLLLPEISLTPQVVTYFQSRFGNLVGLIHSGLSLRQRRDTDTLIRRGEIRIVIGTRSAVFAPLQDIGLIIMDEEGERTYKSEQSPRYHTTDIARIRCKYHGAVLVLASATPSIESRYLADRGVYTLLRMDQRYNQAPLPTVSIVDMNREGGATFAQELMQGLRENLRNGEQSILLLNRRGYRTLLQCTQCYEPLYCPNCSVPMTYHKTNDSLMCHYCGHIQSTDVKCPKCGNPHMRLMGLGTQKLEEELQQLLPEARILRMDADAVMTRSAYEERFAAFAAGKYDILCGTQMIGKGLDFPNVTLVGVVSVDKALFGGDFRSYERTFSLVTQVVGRSGRGTKPGRAILQTYMPNHYVLNLAAKQDYDRFYEEELQLRRTLTFPPVCDLCVIGFSGIEEEKVRRASEHFVELIRAEVEKEQLRLPLRVLGPVDAAYGRINGRFRRRLLMKCKNTKEMRAFIRALLEQASRDKGCNGMVIYADMNGECGV